MASVAVAGIFNALAFAGAGFLFKMLDKNGYAEENRRHNKAMEKLARDKEAWYERETRRKDRIARIRQEKADATSDMVAVNKSLDLYRKIHDEMGADLIPIMDDYYEPSDEMKGYQHMASGVLGLGTGGLLAYLVG